MIECRLLIVDIDDTIRAGKTRLGRFVNGPDDVELLPGVLDIFRGWKEDGRSRIVGVSNQGGVGLGLVGERDVRLAMVETSRQAEGLIDCIRWCPHAPDACCWCRKPRPGMALDAVRDLQTTWHGEVYPANMALFVGDRPEDEQCARALDVAFVWADRWRNGGLS